MTIDAEHGPAPAVVRVEGRGRALHRARAAGGGGGAGQVGGGALLWHRAEGGVLGGVELGGGAGGVAGRGAEVRVAVGGGVARVPHRQHARVPVAAGGGGVAGGVAGGGQLAGGLQRAVAVAVCEAGPGGGAVGGVVLGADQVLCKSIKLDETYSHISRPPPAWAGSPPAPGRLRPSCWRCPPPPSPPHPPRQTATFCCSDWAGPGCKYFYV